MATIEIGDGVRVRYPDGDDDFADYIGVEANGVEVAAWSIAEDPKAEAVKAAHGYRAAYEAGVSSVLQSDLAERLRADADGLWAGDDDITAQGVAELLDSAADALGGKEAKR
jgi:hypothetical protein